MRLAYNPTFLYDDQNRQIGISLGADFTAEHEWGIDSLYRKFSANDSSVKGLAGYIIQQIPENFSHFDYKDSYGLGFGTWENVTTSNSSTSEFFYKDKTQLFHPRSPSILEELYLQLTPDPHFKSHNIKDFVGAWDKEEFAVTTIKHKDFLEKIFHEMKSKNVVMMLSGGRTFQNSGLSFILYDRIPKKIIQTYIEQEESNQRLKDFVERTDIHNILSKARKKYYALSPQWVDSNEKDVKFWLNPCEQDIHQFGWYNVEDLKLWAEDKGPVMDCKRAKRKS